MINKQTILWLVVLSVGIVLILIVGLGRENESGPEEVVNLEETLPSPSLSPLPSIEGTKLPQPTPFTTSTPIKTPDPVSGGDSLLGKLPMAECVVSGSIEFISPSLYISEEAFINYKNIDSVARHINWSITPDDDVLVGPNLFADLPIPDGKKNISISFNGEPKYKDYTLGATVTYGVLNNRNLEIHESECTGAASVKISY